MAVRSSRFSRRNLADPTLNRSQIDQLALLQRDREQVRELAHRKGLNEQRMAMIQSLFGGMGGTQDKYAQAETLYARGGQFGEGSRAAIHRAAQQRVAMANVKGMKEGISTAGIGAAATEWAGIENKRIEEERLKRLEGTLLASGAANLEKYRIMASAMPRLY